MIVKEDELKNAVLKQLPLFLSHNKLMDKDAKIIFERKIDYGKTITDSIIFNKDSIVGIELKSEYDTLRRLQKQLDSYLKVCNYVYVLIADKFVNEVLDMITHLSQYSCVGILSYEVFDDDILIGEVKKPQFNSNINERTLIDSLLNHAEMATILRQYQKGFKDTKYRSPEYLHFRNLTKKMLAQQWMIWFDVQQSVSIISYVYRAKKLKRGLNIYGWLDKYQNGSRAWKDNQYKKYKRTSNKTNIG